MTDHIDPEAQRIADKLHANAARILADAERNDSLTALLDAAATIVLEIAGAYASAQVPGAAVAVGPAKVVLRTLVEKAADRAAGRVA
jgi:hypothetical protein